MQDSIIIIHDHDRKHLERSFIYSKNGLPKCTVSGLQAVQNSAARIVTQERLRDHDSMSRALIGLHWLPVDIYIHLLLLTDNYLITIFLYDEVQHLVFHITAYICNIVCLVCLLVFLLIQYDLRYQHIL